MRVLITGARGQVGQELLQRAPGGFEVIGLGSAELDIRDAQAVGATVARLQPELIINAAAYTAVDKAESDAGQAWAVNCEGVRHLALVAQAQGIPLMHISTDYVFAGDAREAYREEDATGPTSVYGASKLGGEQVLRQYCPQHVILRTSWVFGAYGHNFVKTMLRLGRERNSLNVVADQQGCPTAALGIADALWRMTERYREHGSLPWGTYHLRSLPACSWHMFACEIFRQAHSLGLLPRIPDVKAISSAEYPTPARRPAWSVLDSSKLFMRLGICANDWRTDLAEVLRALRCMQQPHDKQGTQCQERGLLP